MALDTGFSGVRGWLSSEDCRGPGLRWGAVHKMAGPPPSARCSGPRGIAELGKRCAGRNGLRWRPGPGPQGPGPFLAGPRLPSRPCHDAAAGRAVPGLRGRKGPLAVAPAGRPSPGGGSPLRPPRPGPVVGGRALRGLRVALRGWAALARLRARPSPSSGPAPVPSAAALLRGPGGPAKGSAQRAP